MEDLFTWYSELTPRVNPNVSETRDVFDARAQKMIPVLLKNKFSIEDARLIYSIIGEIGNNAYDHNLGLWKDQPGCFLFYDLDETGLTVVLADRGRGMFSSLKRVIPDLVDDQEAIETAFQKVISGRSPEQRGNGLKFVRQIINGNSGRALIARSDSGIVSFGGNRQFIEDFTARIKAFTHPVGTLILVRWDRS